MTTTLFRPVIATPLLLVCFPQVAWPGDGPYDIPGKVVKAKPPMHVGGPGSIYYYIGYVTEVTKDSITIQWPDEPKPKRFEASAILASGGFPTRKPDRPDGRPGYRLSLEYRYRLSDVKVGDRVYIHYSHLGDKDRCDNISIVKRPGGRHPPLPKGVENLEGRTGWEAIPYHERIDALWDLEDKGIPYPEKFGPMRRWPIAPMPRKLTLDGPIISK